ncbi:hypothetical protein ACFHWD_19995 [Clostridium sp. MT-14]|uniref:Uncharacterized protein n=1 Tax=Clostridium aromativorans TaxID=2836848 RepID=A0ABS8NAG2_9CLOT|nr:MULTISPECIES: hypothetical protein [Clostridium]KAA8666934.1 hypothetical protein F3O63_16420 [Clostridium sp. HV4-5-A1G]MCC9296811.1 hypothetical protein [Clostridium aromativorans]CAB1249576.1 Eukaryotic translation initiation factor 5 [Clostridiaceae bacterium BL-3]
MDKKNMLSNNSNKKNKSKENKQKILLNEGNNIKSNKTINSDMLNNERQKNKGDKHMENVIDREKNINDEYNQMLKLKKVGKSLKDLLNIDQEDINKAIKEMRSEWK